MTKRIHSVPYLPAQVMNAMAYHGFQVNGSLRTSQENGTNNLTASGAFPADNWSVIWTGAMAISHKQITSGPFTTMPPIKNAIEIEVTTADTSIAAGDRLFAFTTIEGRRLANEWGWGTANARPVSIGWMLRSNVTTRAYISLQNSATARSQVFVVDLIANTDKYVELPAIPGDISGTWLTDTGAGLHVNISFTAGSTYQTTVGAWQAGNYKAASDIGNLCATVGNKAWVGPMVVLPGNDLPTAEQLMGCFRQIEDEERECQRLWKWADAAQGWVRGGGAITVATPDVAKMRIIPIGTIVNGVGGWHEPSVAFRDISAVNIAFLGDYIGFTAAAATVGSPGNLRSKVISLSARF